MATLSETVLDRLNDTVEALRQGEVPPIDSVLVAFGQLIKFQRIGLGQTRQEMAEKLGIEVDALLLIEVGLCFTSDLNQEQRHKLSDLIRQNFSDDEIVQEIVKVVVDPLYVYKRHLA